MILDLFKQQQPKHLPVAYFLFKTIEKELLSLADTLGKDLHTDPQDPFREFKLAVDKELEGVRVNLGFMMDCL